MKRLTTWLAVAVLTVLPAVAAGTQSPQHTVRGRAVDQHGNTHDLGEPAGTYTVLELAASWCTPCYQALPELEKLAREVPEVRFLVLSVDEKVAGRDRLVRDLSLSLPVLWDEQQSIVERLAPEAFPATYLLDPDGKIMHRVVGTRRDQIEHLADLVRELGARKPEAAPDESSVDRGK